MSSLSSFIKNNVGVLQVFQQVNNSPLSTKIFLCMSGQEFESFLTIYWYNSEDVYFFSDAALGYLSKSYLNPYQFKTGLFKNKLIKLHKVL